MRWFRAAVLVTVGVSALLLLLPLSTEQIDGRTLHRSLLATEGPGIVVPLVVPVAICAIPLLAPARHRRAAGWGSVVLLSLGIVVSLFSIGVFYLPSVVVLGIGAARGRRPGRPAHLRVKA